MERQSLTPPKNNKTTSGRLNLERPEVVQESIDRRPVVVSPREENVELPLPSISDKTYWLRPSRGYPWTSVNGPSGIADEEVRRLAVEQHRVLPASYPLAPAEYEQRLQSADVMTFATPQMALEAAKRDSEIICRRAEILYNVTSGLTSREPAPWVKAVVQEVAEALGVGHEIARERVGFIPKQWDKPLPVNGPAGFYVREAVGLCSEMIWLKAANEAPVDAARHVTKLLEGEDALQAWLGSHRRLQDFFETRSDWCPSASEIEVAMMAYGDFVDRVGMALLDSITIGSGNLNPNIPMDMAGNPEHTTDLGGYPLYYITEDGGVLSPEAVQENQDLTNDPNDQEWYVIGVEVNYEDTSLMCDHTGKLIPSAYGGPDDANDHEPSGEIECSFSSLPSWPGASAVYSEAYMNLEKMAQKDHGGGSFPQNIVSPEMRDAIDALNKGDEMRIKAFNRSRLNVDRTIGDNSSD